MDSKRIDTFGKEEAEAYKIIAKYKWKDVFVCSNCNCEEYFEGKFPYSRRCLKCKKDFSPTAGTILHGVRFPLYIALYIAWVVAAKEDRITSEELTEYIAHKFKREIRQKTVWAFLMKVYSAMTLPELRFDEDFTIVKLTRGSKIIIGLKSYLDNKPKYLKVIDEEKADLIIKDLIKKCKANNLQFEVHNNTTNATQTSYSTSSLLLAINRAITGVNPKYYQQYLNFYCFAANGYKYEDLMRMLVNPSSSQ